MTHRAPETQWAATWIHHISHIKWTTWSCPLDLEFIPSLYSPPFSFLQPCVSFVAICSSFPHWIGLPRLPTWIQPSFCSTPMLSPASHRALPSVSLHQSRGSSPTPPSRAHQPLGTTAVCALVYVRDISLYLSLHPWDHTQCLAQGFPKVWWRNKWMKEINSRYFK